MSSRTLTLRLRREAEVEAVRLLAARRRSLDEPFESTREILVSALKVAPQSPLQPPCAIFFLDGWIVDAAGRALERRLVPVRFAAGGIGAVAKRRDVRAQAQSLFARYGADAIAAARDHLERRAMQVAAEFGHGLTGAVRREAHARKNGGGDSGTPVQAGLFDRRAIRNRQAGHRERASASADRPAALHAGTAAISSREPEILFLLIVGRRA